MLWNIKWASLDDVECPHKVTFLEKKNSDVQRKLKRWIGQYLARYNTRNYSRCPEPWNTLCPIHITISALQGMVMGTFILIYEINQLFCRLPNL